MNQRLKRFCIESLKELSGNIQGGFGLGGKPWLILVQNRTIRKKPVHRSQVPPSRSFLFRLTLLTEKYIITKKGVKNEKNIPAFQDQKGQGPRFQKEEQDQRRKKGPEEKKDEEKKEIDREDQREIKNEKGGVPQISENQKQKRVGGSD